MVINFGTREISRGVCKLIRIPTSIIIIKNDAMETDPIAYRKAEINK
jgi:2-succinyl-5-enolpyruvyl-6-hydroxy-3-cyclohexene-1-carboxylate synthase